MSNVPRPRKSSNTSPNPCCDPDDDTWCLECCNTPPASWPAWTDTVRAELPASSWPAWADMEVPAPSGDYPFCPAPAEATPEEWAEWFASTRDDRPDPPTDRATWLPAAEYVGGEIARHRNDERDGCDIAGLVVTAMNDLLIVLKDRKVPTADDLVALPGHSYSGLDLDAVTVPQYRSSPLADMLDEEASYYLHLETRLGRLVAAAILRHAEDCERIGARSLQDLLDDDAACLAACEDLAEEECETPWNPLY